jgi:hypothetical protein
MHLTELIVARFRKPGRKARVIGGNLLFLLWAGILLVGLTHADLLGRTALEDIETPRVTVEPLPVAEPLTRHSQRPLASPSEDAAVTEALADAAAVPLDLPAPPDYPRVGLAHHNPGFDPEVGMRHYDQASLAWLTHHQHADGYWSAAYFSDNSCREGASRTGGYETGDWNADLAATSLALLSYVGAGYDHKEGEFRANVRQAILWMRRNQHETGFTGARGVRDHALAVTALSECYGLSGDPAIKTIADKAVQQLIEMRDFDSGWGKYRGCAADMISTAYGVLAIKTACISGLEFDAELPGLDDFVASLAEDGRTRYSIYAADPPGSTKDGLTRPPVCAAAWMLTMLFRGAADLADERIKQRAALLAQADNLPKWERGCIDFEYWWLGCMATYQVGSKTWKAWETALSKTLLGNQRGFTTADKNYGLTSATKLDEHGSWDAADIWCADGRVATTAMATLCLEVYYRYERLAELSDDVIEDE